MMINRKINGVGLIELLIALVISSLSLVAVVQLFIQTKVSYVSNEAITRLQENGRFGIQMMARDIRSADFWGCMPTRDGDAGLNIDPLIANLVDSGGGAVTLYDDAIFGVDGGTGAAIAGSTQQPDTLTIISAQTARAYPLAANKVESGDPVPFTVEGDSGIDQGDLVMVGECTHAQIFQVTNEPDPTPVPSGERVAILQHATGGVTGNPNPRNATNQLERPFTDKAMVYPRMRTVTYSVGPDGTSPLNALLRNGQPIVTGVENLQIQYGLDTDGDSVVDRYVPANNVADFAQVMSIRIGLLVRSPDARNETAADYNLLGQSVAAASITAEANNLFPSRRVYTQTIAFRNREQY